MVFKYRVKEGWAHPVEMKLCSQWVHFYLNDRAAAAFFDDPLQPALHAWSEWQQHWITTWHLTQWASWTYARAHTHISVAQCWWCFPGCGPRGPRAGSHQHITDLLLHDCVEHLQPMTKTVLKVSTLNIHPHTHLAQRWLTMTEAGYGIAKYWLALLNIICVSKSNSSMRSDPEDESTTGLTVCYRHILWYKRHMSSICFMTSDLSVWTRDKKDLFSCWVQMFEVSFVPSRS